jgi:hypothetical protein
VLGAGLPQPVAEERHDREDDVEDEELRPEGDIGTFGGEADRHGSVDDGRDDYRRHAGAERHEHSVDRDHEHEHRRRHGTAGAEEVHQQGSETEVCPGLERQEDGAELLPPDEHNPRPVGRDHEGDEDADADAVCGIGAGV